MNKVRNYTWELLQNIIGFFIALFTGFKKYDTYKTATLYTWGRKEGLSLGNYIFVPYKKGQEVNEALAETFIKHEYGHTLQSKMLGPFYLLVIGLPSMIWASCFTSFRRKNCINYYEFYTEKWADKLGEVNR